MIKKYKELIQNKYGFVKRDICLKEHLIGFVYLINGGLIQILKHK